MAKQRVKLAWHQRKPEEFERQKREVQMAYPHLHFYLEGETMFIRGSFPIEHNGDTLERYSIEITLPSDYPTVVPIVRETGGQIPRLADNHFNSANGELCLFVPTERWRYFPVGATLLDFLNGPVRNHLLGLSLRRLGEKWPFGERSHGEAGIIESYSELLGTREEAAIIQYVECLSKPNLKGHWPCPCGSGKKLRQCHLPFINDLRQKVSVSDAAKSLSFLKRARS